MIDGELMNEIHEAAAKGKTSLHEKACETCCGSGEFDRHSYTQDCPTCDGTGLVTEWVENIPACQVDCHVCHGTGKENAK